MVEVVIAREERDTRFAQMVRTFQVMRLVLLVSCLCPSAAAASTPVYQVYALTNADTLYGVLNGMAALMQSAGFSHVLVAFGLLGLFWAIVLAAMQRRPTRLVGYLLSTAMVIHFALKQHVTVSVVSKTDDKAYLVDNVPTLIALPASWMSTLGFEGAKVIDAAYATVAGMSGTLTFTGGKPFSITNQLLKDASTYRLRDSYLRASLTHFIADCGMPLLANGGITLTALLGSGDLWSLFAEGGVNPALQTVYYGDERHPLPRGEVLTCPIARQRINASLPQARERMLTRLSPGLSAGISAELFQLVLDYHANGHLNNPSAGDYLQQAALLDLVNGSVRTHLASGSQNAALLQSLAVEQAAQATELNWQTTAEVFARTFGYLYTVIQLLVYAVAPMLLLLAVFPGAMRTLGKRYLMLLAWFPLTFMMLAIANDFIVSWTHNELGNVFGEFGGLAQASQALITAKAAKLQAVGAYIVSLVPLLAWAILEGGQYAISQIITHSGAQTFGHQAGQVAASGNMTLDSQQYQSVSANKTQLTRQVDLGAMPITSSASGGDGLLKVDFGGNSAVRNAAPDMMQLTQQHHQQSSHSSANTTHHDQGQQWREQFWVNEQTSVSESVSNSTNTSAQVGGNLSGLGTKSAAVLTRVASRLGVGLGADTAAAAGNDMAQAQREAAASAKAAEQGDSAAARMHQAQAQGWFRQAFGAFKAEPWYTEAAVGALAVGGMAALYGSGVGEALAGVTGVGAVAARVAGYSLGAAAAEEGVAGSVAAASVNTAGTLQATAAGTVGQVATATMSATEMGAAQAGVAEAAAAGASTVGATTAGAATPEEVAVAEAAASSATSGGASAPPTAAAKAASSTLLSTRGKLITGGITAVSSLLNGVSAGIRESYSGEHATRLNAEFSGSHQVNADVSHLYSESDKVEHQQQVLTSTSWQESVQVPGQDFKAGLGLLPTNNTDNIAPAADGADTVDTAAVLGDTDDRITHAAESLAQQRQALDQRVQQFQAGAKQSIKQRSGLNQLHKTEQQKKAGDYHV